MLTQAEIDAFHRDGFLIIRNMFAGDELEALRAAADRVQAEGMAERGRDHIYHDVDGEKTYYRSEEMWQRDPIFQAVTVKPELLTCIGQCVGHPFMPINDSFVCKIPGGNVPVEWHQDPPYSSPNWQGNSGLVPNFDTDIYLDESTVENGCVWGIRGRHLVGHVEMAHLSQQELFEECGAVPMEMQPGDVLFHSISAPHGSVGNTTDTIRRIFYVHYMARAVLEHCYPDWMESKICYDADGRAAVEQMLATRRKMGYSTIENSAVQWTDKGFVFSGSPTTPEHHWGKLFDKLSADEVAEKRILNPDQMAMA